MKTIIEQHSRFFVLKYSILTILLFSGWTLRAQTVVNSLSQLKSAVTLSNQNIVMTPGEYNLETGLSSGNRVITFSGSNNTITLTDVYIQVPVGCINQCYLTITGNNNTVINGEVEDVYRNGMEEVTDFSAYNNDRTNQAYGLRGAPVMHIEGRGNEVTGLKLTVRGSFPYGYGSMYGIGADNVFGLNKRCGILITGVKNTLDSVEVQQRAFGHGIFMQGDADSTLIKNSLVEGRVRSTAELYTETNSYDLPYLTGYTMPQDGNIPIPTNKVHSLCEDGIRMYNIPGSITVENCTVKKMRGGIRLYLGGKAIVRNSTAIDCGLTNYNTQSGGEIINSSGNFKYTTLQNYRLNRSNTNIELTIIPSPDAVGTHNIANIDGNNHNIVFHRTPGPLDITDRAIVVTGKNSTIVNETEYPILLSSSSSGNKITSCGPVTNLGSSNTITLSDCDFEVFCSNTPENLQAECYDNMSGVETLSIDSNQDALTNIQSGDWIRFNGVDLTDKNAVMATVGSVTEGATIEVRDGSENGDLLATIVVPNTGSIDAYEISATAALTEPVSGTKDVYFVFRGTFNVDKLSFTNESCLNAEFNPLIPIEAEDYCAAEGVIVEDIETFNQNVGEINNGDYIVFPNVNFNSENGYNSVQVYAASNSKGGKIEVRSGAVDGLLLTTIEIDNTGGWSEYQSFAGYTENNITGMHNIYLVFTGADGYLFNVDNIYFRNNPCGHLVNAYDQTNGLDYCEMYGIKPINNEYVGNIDHGDWIRFGSLDFTDVAPLSLKLNVSGLSSTTGYINVMLDDPVGGTLIASATMPATGGWENWKDVLVPMNLDVTGVHNVYFYFGNSSYNLNYFQFSDVFVKGPTNPYERFEAEIYDDASGLSTAITTDIDGAKELTNLENGDYIVHAELNLEEADSIKIRVASDVDACVIEIRAGKTTGQIIGFVDVPNTGSKSAWTTVETKVGDIAGENDIYFVVKGEGNDLVRMNWLQFTKYSNPNPKLEVENNNGGSDGLILGTTSDPDDNGTGSVLRYVSANKWIQFDNVDLSAAKSIDARYSTSLEDAFVEVRIDAIDGPLIAEIDFPNTGSWNLWSTVSTSIEETSGIHTVFFVYKTESSALACNSNWFQFSGLEHHEIIRPQIRIEAENYNRAFGTNTIPTSDVNGEMELSSIENGDWILFKNVDLSGAKTINLRIANANDGSRVELRTGAYDGSFLSFINVPNTGSLSNWETLSANVFSADGVKDVYAVFKGTASELLNVNWLQFSSFSLGAENIQISNVSIYPNPVKDDVTLTGALGANLDVYNVEGKRLITRVINTNEYTFKTTQLQQGVYFFRVSTPQGLVKNYKIMKQ